jgi:hypothetical protein
MSAGTAIRPIGSVRVTAAPPSAPYTDAAAYVRISPVVM